MATDVVDDQEMREAQRDYLDFLDDDVSETLSRFNSVVGQWMRPRGHNNRSLQSVINNSSVCNLLVTVKSGAKVSLS